MNYYAKSENAQGKKESVQHHLLRTAELCETFAGEFGEAAAGCWMGRLHDFGKYSRHFQNVLEHTEEHIDHALPGAGVLVGALGIKKPYSASARWPIAVAVRAHHGVLDYSCDGELTSWGTGKTERTADGKTISLSMVAAAGENSMHAAQQVFLREVGCPALRPERPSFSGDEWEQAVQKMLYTRFLFSALTDADYTASAENEQPDYLAHASLENLDAKGAWTTLEQYRADICRSSPADSSINQLRTELFADCQAAGASCTPGLYTLTAPTGTGKTLAMLAFALQHAIRYGMRRIIVVLPYLSIIEQNAAVYRHILPNLLEDDSQTGRDGDNPEMGRELSQRWDAPMIITTSVKFFQGLFACRGPECRKLHQLAGSIILFDEAQSLPVQLAGATLKSIQELCTRYHSTVVFSTATQPAFEQLKRVNWAPKELVPHTQNFFDRARRVTPQWHWNPVPLEEVARAAAQKPNACILVNLRRHAQKMFRLLQNETAPENVFLLSTDLCPAHRTEILEQLRRRLKEGLPCYLVATQCIEAGVDISFDVLYRALAPLESIIQAAGRCNRNGGRVQGELHIFIPDEPGRKYPEAFYEEGAHTVQALAAQYYRKGREIDLNNLEQIHDYYRLLYQGGAVQDKQALTDAIESMDFAAVEKEYRLIEQAGVQVIVPYSGQQALFDQLQQQAVQGITASWLRSAAPLSLTSFDQKLVQDTCEPLYTPARAGCPPEKTKYFLLANAALYDSDRMGLMLSRDTDMIY